MQNNQSLINRNRASCSVLVALIILGILARVTVIHNENMDTSVFLIPWYDYITSHGIAKAMGDIFANYTPFYTYLLALVTTIPIPKLIAIKLIPIVMDMLNSFVVYKIIKQKYKTGLAPLWACAIFWCLPTVILNSAFWGQADSLYTGFLLNNAVLFNYKSPVFGSPCFLCFNFNQITSHIHGPGTRYYFARLCA